MWNNIGHTDHLSMSNQTFNVDLVQADCSPLVDSFDFNKIFLGIFGNLPFECCGDIDNPYRSGDGFPAEAEASISAISAGFILKIFNIWIFITGKY